jgi:geranylgeranyl pyrophosphate synthase
MLNPWLGLAQQATWLLFEAQWVVAARMARLAAGGALAQTESQRMVTEKTAVFVEANVIAAAAVVGGRKAPATAKHVLRMYGKRVRANRRRLMRSRRR